MFTFASLLCFRRETLHVNSTYTAVAVGSVVVRSTFAYKAAQKDEISFPIDAVINDVEKKDGGWWSGTCVSPKGGGIKA